VKIYIAAVEALWKGKRGWNLIDHQNWGWSEPAATNAPVEDISWRWGHSSHLGDEPKTHPPQSKAFWSFRTLLWPKVFPSYLPPSYIPPPSYLPHLILCSLHR
jgi:hypothetical protein